ncbi:MAG TPA: VWA domain-containing protein [Pyrinomonadaceae bacterium]|nr:VWA domain-containing protein [Pyrinomonadaceae bacterium]
MKLLSQAAIRSLSATVCLAALLNATSLAQQPQKPADDDVLRVRTELVQSAVTVVDKDGRFVNGLSRDQFELIVDGKPRPISFFEQVTSGSPREQQLASVGKAADPAAKTVSTPVVKGRRIIFFVDDSHLSPDSMNRTRQMLHQFLERDMTPKDTVAIVSASGQVGFLQQFTNNKKVLEAARDRLSPRPYDARGFGTGSTRMTEYLALSIENTKSDNKVQGFFIGECLKQAMPSKRSPAYATLIAALKKTCETDVRSSARAVLIQAGDITRGMYASLENLIRSSARAPGRKLAFFISDGFLMDLGPQAANLRDKLDRVIDAATRAGVVIYTIDARGLNTNTDVDVANTRPRTGSGDPGLDMAMIGEIAATQDAMNGLAGDTGGRALRNMNYFDRWVEKVLDETSNYYLLAWRPENAEEKAPKFRHVQFRVIDHPELTARAPKGYVTGPQATETANATIPKQAANHVATVEDAEIRDALADYYPSAALPTVLSLTYLNTPNNQTVLTSSIQVATNRLTFGSDGQQPASLRLAGVVLNDKGKIAHSFKNQLSVKPLNGQLDSGSVLYNEPTPLAPGIYQVRVAARDEKSGRVGSAMEWVVIPDLTNKQLTLSSLLLGGQVLDRKSNADGAAQVQLSVDHRFARSGKLGYWFFVYNAKRDAVGATSLMIQSQVERDGKVMLSSPQRKVNQAGPDPDRIPFGDELALQTLAPGTYDLRVTITDSMAGTSVTQMIDFVVL